MMTAGLGHTFWTASASGCQTEGGDKPNQPNRWARDEGIPCPPRVRLTLPFLLLVQVTQTLGPRACLDFPGEKQVPQSQDYR